ncbi:MAG: hypothetical protein J6S76_00450 [Clostridia bacterium]|nr:hypothetical protein [Clostridia bacterium]
MADNRAPERLRCDGFCGTGGGYDAVYIDTDRILDSCRDKDCFENVRVYLTDIGQEIVDRASSVRAKKAEIVDTCISVSPMTFNRGFYQIHVRIFVHMEFETCVCAKAQCIDGLAVVEKSVILFGGEGHVRIFRSKAQNGPCCAPFESGHTSDDNLPQAVFEVADPVVLSARILEKCSCQINYAPCGSGGCACSCSGDIPDGVLGCLGGALCRTDDIEHVLVVALGFFSVIRIERPAQFLVSAAEYCVPEKECVFTEDDDPCAAFRRMAFPVDQFCPRQNQQTGKC